MINNKVVFMNEPIHNKEDGDARHEEHLSFLSEHDKLTILKSYNTYITSKI